METPLMANSENRIMVGRRNILTRGIRKPMARMVPKPFKAETIKSGLVDLEQERDIK